jgi:hypothetical protein
VFFFSKSFEQKQKVLSTTSIQFMEDFSIQPTSTSNQYTRKYHITNSNSANTDDSNINSKTRTQQSSWLRSMTDYSTKYISIFAFVEFSFILINGVKNIFPFLGLKMQSAVIIKEICLTIACKSNSIRYTKIYSLFCTHGTYLFLIS